MSVLSRRQSLKAIGLTLGGVVTGVRGEALPAAAPVVPAAGAAGSGNIIEC